MGASLTNYFMCTKSCEGLVAKLPVIISARAYLVCLEGKWLALFDEGSEQSSDTERHKLAREMSKITASGVFCFIVFDSDIFGYILYNKGKFEDEYWSRSDYFILRNPGMVGGNISRIQTLLTYCEKNVRSEVIHEVLESGNYEFEEQRLTALGAILGISEEMITCNFDDFALVIGERYPRDGVSVIQITGRHYSRLCQNLFLASEKGDVGAVKILLSEGIDPNCADTTGLRSSPLVAAILGGHGKVAVLLLDAGAKASHEALMASAILNDTMLIQRLIKAGCDPSAKHESGRNALWNAIMCGAVDAVKALVMVGADVNCQYEISYEVPAFVEKGYTPLLYAVRRGNVNIVETLLHAGANADYISPAGEKALSIAERKGKEEIIKVLREWSRGK